MTITRVSIMVVAFVSLLGIGPVLAQEVQPGGSGGAVAKFNPDAAGVYHQNGTGMTMPQVVTHPNPEYTEAARKEKIKGDCFVSLVVDAEGVPQNVRVIRSIAEMNPDKVRGAAVSLDEKAVEAVRQYRFKPAIYQGKPVPVELRIAVNFQIFLVI